ncbi:MAG TPA: STAS/SEC14 domain-containing protein [Kineosporiaceae bacterium]|nr:STAS/SEC14 domain-containing protein [Kineosporiaceae bacterium]
MPIINEPTDFGCRVAFLDPLTVTDLQRWARDVESAVAGRSGFGLVIDVRHHDRAGRDVEVTHALRDAMIMIRGWGLRRAALIVPDQIAARRLMRLVQGYTPDIGERFIDGRHPGCEEAARAWILYGDEPFETLTPTWRASLSAVADPGCTPA